MVMRVVLIVLDSAGIGELPDAPGYGDQGSNTIANTAKAVGGLKLPNMQKLGLGNLGEIHGVPACSKARAAFGKAAELSPGKDTTTGHWEIAGIILDRPFPVYPEGFPACVINEFEKRTGTGVLGNKPASGTEIIRELGEVHMKTGRPIVYTSADSVFQIAAHEKIIQVEKLYEMCRIAREILSGEHAVARVIARPFSGGPGSFKRTTHKRKDFSLKPPRETLLDKVSGAGMGVIAIGKIEDIFAGKGITEAVHTKGNMCGIQETLRAMGRLDRGLIFTNLVDFDTLYGHRNNPHGYARALEEFDQWLPEIISRLRRDDVLIITADHGCDPTTESTDHSREYVPVLVTGERVRKGTDLGVLSTFADIGQTIAQILDCGKLESGNSFKDRIM
jgi:phosphopentomutase